MSNTQLIISLIATVLGGAIGWIWKGRKTSAEAKKLEAEKVKIEVETDTQRIKNDQLVSDMWRGLYEELKQDNEQLEKRVRKQEELLLASQRELAGIKPEITLLEARLTAALEENSHLKEENARQREKLTQFRLMLPELDIDNE